MSVDYFRVRKSAKRGYLVELCRDDRPYVTFLDGLTLQGAERRALSLTALWRKISIGRKLAPLQTQG